MMDKKSILAFIIIFLIILAMPSYFKLFNGPGETNGQDPTTPTTTIISEPVPQNNQPTKQQTIDNSLFQNNSEKKIVVDTDKYCATISSAGGGTIINYELKKYSMFDNGDTIAVQLINNPENFPLSIKYISISGDSIILDQNFLVEETSPESPKNDTIHLSEGNQSSIKYILKDNNNNLLARKTLTFTGNSYSIDVKTDLRNLQQEMATDYYELCWDSGLKYTENYLVDEVRYSKAFAFSGGETDALDVKNNKKSVSRFNGKTDWTALRTKYFTAAFICQGNSLGYKLSGSGVPISGKEYYKNFNMQLSLPVSVPTTTTLYLGPLEYSTIKNMHADLENIMSLGKLLKPISKAVLWIFVRLYTVIPNYGWVLIVFAFLIKIVLHPLTDKSQRSMKEMQNLQPKIEELRKKHPNDPQKLNTEQMKLYKEHGVNPMGGCLPLLLQMPILIALFTVFRTTIELRHAPFIWWITDLSAPDTIFTLPFSIPIYGKQVNVLPIIMALSTILQQKLSGGNTTNPQQKMMAYMMPIMFFFMFNQFPSGLNLYYTLYNLLTVAQQKFIPTRPPKKKTGPSTIETIRKIQSRTKFK